MIVSLMLICAVGASLALGVLVAYGVCLVMFRAFRFHVVSLARERVHTGAVRAAVEG